MSNVLNSKNQKKAVQPSKSTQSIESLLANAAIFASLNEEDLKPIAQVCKKMTHKAGNALFSQGEPARHFFYILSGSVRLYRLTADGKKKVIEIIQKGETFAEAVALVDKFYPVHAETIDDTEMIWVPASVLRGLIEADVSIALKMLSSLSIRLHKFVNDIHALSMSNAEQKVASYFLAFLDESITNQHIELPSKKSIVASRLGLQPETFSRVLRKMKSHGILEEDDHGFVILQPNKLKDIWQVL